MWLRLTVDDERRIVACEAASDHTPYAICPAAAPNFARLAGLQIKPGFLKEAARRVGGTLGCTHLRELLQQMATTAYQTIDPARAKREADAAGEADTPGSDRLDMRISRQDGRGAGDPEHLHRLRHRQPGGAAALAALYTGPGRQRPHPAIRRRDARNDRMARGPAIRDSPPRAPARSPPHRKYCSTNTRTALVRPPLWPVASI